MNRLARVQRLWMGRRLALLGGSAAIAAGAFVLQVARLRQDPNGAAVHGVALLVTLIVFAILLRLVRLQLAGPGLAAPSWERHAHRASLREAPLVSVVGAAVAAILALATPHLILEESPAAPAQIAVDVPEPIPQAPPETPAVAKREPDPPARVVVAPKPVELARVEPKTESHEPPAFMRLSDPAPIANFRPKLPLVEVNYQDWENGGQEKSQQDRLQEPVDPTQPSRDAILRAVPEDPLLPPVHFGVGALLAVAKGDLDLNGGSGGFHLDLDSVRGEQTFEMGVDVTAEFSLTPESSLKIVYAGMGIFERGRLTEDTTFGSVAAQNGDRYEFEMRWSHLYLGLSKHLTGHTRESWLGLSVHAGAIIDHTLAEFESEASGVGAESEDGERGWVSPGVGLSLSLRGPGSTDAVIDVVQSLPINIGGQSIALTDLRAGLKTDLSEAISLFLGYRYVRAVYRLFDEPLVREGGSTVADLAVRGPVLGLDFRF